MKGFEVEEFFEDGRVMAEHQLHTGWHHSRYKWKPLTCSNTIPHSIFEAMEKENKFLLHPKNPPPARISANSNAVENTPSVQN